MAKDSNECLISLLGVLTNIGLVDGIPAKMATAPLISGLSELLGVAQNLPVGAREGPAIVSSASEQSWCSLLE